MSSKLYLKGGRVDDRTFWTAIGPRLDHERMLHGVSRERGEYGAAGFFGTEKGSAPVLIYGDSFRFLASGGQLG